MESTPSKSFSTPTNSKKPFMNFDNKYMIKLKYDEEDDTINIISYETADLEIKRYEVKISKLDFNVMNKLFRVYDKCEEIYDLIVEIIETNRYKINKINEDDKIIIQLYFIIVNNNINISVELKLSTEGDFGADFNSILRNEIIKLKKLYNKEINELKTQNKAIINELNEIKQIIKNLRNSDDKKILQPNLQTKELDLTGKKIDINLLKDLVNYPNLEKLKLCNNNISDINILNNCNFNQLQILNFSMNQIRNISVFEKLKFQKLNELYLDKNKIYNIVPLSKINLTHLQRLNLSNNDIEDISIIDRINAPHLKYLNLSYNKIYDISVFLSVEFKEIKELYLDNNKIDIDINSYTINFLERRINKFKYK